MIGKPHTRPLRVGVIGLGWGGETHLKAYKQLPSVQVLALAGLEDGKREHLGGVYSVPHLYPHYEDLLALEDLDAVSIAVPNYLHAPIAIAALERGLHVLCEKPLARNGEEVAEMVDAATRANRVLQVVFNQRARGDIEIVKRYIDEGKMGHIYYVKAYWMRRRGIPGAGSWFVNKEMAGGGCLIDLGIHMLDLALYLLGEPEVVSASASTYHELGSQGIGFDREAITFGAGSSFEVEDLAAAFLRLANGATLVLETAWATHSSARDDYGLMLYGTESGADIRATNTSGQDALYLYTDVAGVPSEIQLQSFPSELHLAVVRRFIDTINSGNWSLYNGSEGLRRTRIIDACYASALQGREVSILTPTQPP